MGSLVSVTILLRLLISPSFCSTAESIQSNLKLSASFIKRESQEIVHSRLNPSKIVEKQFRFPSTMSGGGGGNKADLYDLAHYAGYYNLSSTARMFYFFYETRVKNVSAPVVVWLTGGPGCSSALSLLYENGPFYLSGKCNSTLSWRDYGWDKVANIIYLDQPVGTGLSYLNNPSDLRKTTEETAIDFYEFIQAFFKQHPKYAKNDVYIVGESYSGHYIPAFATQIYRGNKKQKEDNQINLKGMAIGDGWTNPGSQIASYPDFALKMNLINASVANQLRNQTSRYQVDLAKACDGRSISACAVAYQEFSVLFNTIVTAAGVQNIYDIRKPCVGPLCYDFSPAERFLNQPSVKKALGVEPSRSFVGCSVNVSDAMNGDEMRNFATGIPELLENGIKLLLYVGEYDFLCNWIGNLKWVSEMKWRGHKGMGSARRVLYKVDGVDAGWVKSYGPLTFVYVKDAGHIVPLDQPKVAFRMIATWIHGESLVT